MYVVIIREYFPPARAGATTGVVMMATFFGMAAGGWMSGLVFDVSGSYRLAFLNGLLWNLLNLGIVAFLMTRRGGAAREPAFQA
jgi:MFS family permease